ncbi:hypothetical protein SAMN04487944_11111 [Gracilibacillus ureilyticus]|uniref:Sulfurtransferase n=1 Tax=Gracilibacillus ureilyticus TaxID=531814 RepID=A0A1H9SFE1_9BACI|nr:hypothetical protein [Gracilibacillus ureilyticus]SER83687.1 hypothetical protein SAMN04487944_11111 [Gracilibacillus ureilyticus]
MLLFIIIGLTLLALIIQIFYVRYMPIKGIPCLDSIKNSDREKVTLDIRDYQQSFQDQIDHAIILPVPYLRRYYQEIPAKKVHIVASDHLEKNIAIRFLKSKGFEVIGYTLTDCKCKKKIEHFA